MKRKVGLPLFMTCLMAVLLVSFQNCSLGRYRGAVSNSSSSEEINSRGGTTTDNPKATMDVALFSNSTTVADAGMCVTGVKFANTTSGLSADVPFYQTLNIPTVVRRRSPLGQVQIPFGGYNRTIVNLSTNCSLGSSLKVTNANGAYKTMNEITLAFDGEFSAGGELTLNIDNLLRNFETVTSESEMETVARNYNGSLTIPFAAVAFAADNCVGRPVGVVYDRALEIEASSVIRAGNACYYIPASSDPKNSISTDPLYLQMYPTGGMVPLNRDPYTLGFTQGTFKAAIDSMRLADGTCVDDEEVPSKSEIPYLAITPIACPQ